MDRCAVDVKRILKYVKAISPRACEIHISGGMCYLLIQKLIHFKIYEVCKSKVYDRYKSRVMCNWCSLLIQRYIPWIQMLLGHPDQDLDHSSPPRKFAQGNPDSQS